MKRKTVKQLTFAESRVANSKKSESLASGEDDKSNFSRSKSLSKPTQKKHYRRSSLSSTSDQTQLNPKNVRRSTRSSQSRPKYNFRTHISSEEEEEEDELEESGSDCSKQKKNRKNQRYVMSEESDESEYKSGRSRSQNQSKAVARKKFSPEGRKPRSEHHPKKSMLKAAGWSDIAAQHKAERLSIMEQLEKNCENNPGKIINPSEIHPERKERQPDLKLDYPTDLDEIAEYWQRDWSSDDQLGWQSKSLSPDNLCTENVIMLKRFNLCPLVKDPSSKTTNFQLNEYKDRKMTVKSFLDEAFVKSLKSALHFGTLLSIQDFENLVPILK
ncbi:hypothetical protein BY996DRAFT_6594603 [Phakopsora pachyrhizi]|nr:hypothetical protein BY996DRAFT_6594603 [Phakopsora pachyrhizi]